MGLSVSSPESSISSSSQDSATGCCAFLKEEDDLEGVGCKESFVREDSSSGFLISICSLFSLIKADLLVRLP